MATILLTWNPVESPRDITFLPQGAAELLRGREFKSRWSAGNTKEMELNTRAFLLRQGSVRPGLVGSGKIIRTPYEDDHWNEKESEAGRKALFVQVEWDALHPEHEMPKTECEKILPRKFLNIPASGCHVTEYSSKIELAWKQHLNAIANRIPLVVDGFRTIISALRFSDQFEKFKRKVSASSDGQPFTSFRNGLPAEMEDYKSTLRIEARRRLNYEKWKGNDIGEGRIFNQMLKSIEIREPSGGLRNNLVAWEEKRFGPNSRSHRILLEKRKSAAWCWTFEEICFNFFKNNISDEDAFSQFTQLGISRYDLIAYLYFLKDSDRYMPIAPTVFDKAFSMLKIPLVTTHHCAWENYVAFNSALLAIRRLLTEVAELDDVRLIDAHSFCWMLARLKLPEVPAKRIISAPRLVGELEAVTISERTDTEPGSRTITAEQFAATDDRKRKLGLLAQAIAIEAEKKRLVRLGHSELIQSVRPVWDQVDLGFDIQSVEEDGSIRHIEVKAIRNSGQRVSFFISDAEWRKSRQKPNYWFYFVAEPASAKPDTIMVPAANVRREFLSPVTYLATFSMPANS